MSAKCGFVSVTVCGAALLVCGGLAGCSDGSESTSRHETTIETPKGETTITVEKEVETSGEAPPAVNP